MKDVRVCCTCKHSLPLQAFNVNQRECRECQAERKMMRRYGITVAQFNEMWDKQGGRCAICPRPFAKTPHIDHCHISGKIRGLLCFTCNIRLGWYEQWKEEIDGYLTAASEN